MKKIYEERFKQEFIMLQTNSFLIAENLGKEYRAEPLTDLVNCT